jgi:hypothetical protein
VVRQRAFAPIAPPSSCTRERIPSGALVGPASDLHYSGGGGGLVRHRACFSNLLVEHRVCPGASGQVGCASPVIASGGGSCRAVGQPRIKGLANLRLQLSAAGAIMTAAAAEADR